MSDLQDLSTFQEQGKKFNSILVLPEFETSSGDLEKNMDAVLKKADEKLNAIGALRPSAIHFESTLKALENVFHEVDSVVSRQYFIWNTSPDAKVRETAQKMVEKSEKWGIQTSYREDIYKAVKTLESKKPKIKDEDLRLLKETIKEYRRNGLHLSKAKRDKLQQLKGELSKLELEFQNNLNSEKAVLQFNRKELEGVQDDYLKDWKVKDDLFEINAAVFSQASVILRNAKMEETRRRVDLARNSVAKTKNIPLLEKILKLRIQIANELGYSNWAALKLEPKMAKRLTTAKKFLNDLNAGLDSKVRAEIAELRREKAKETGDKRAEIRPWDTLYYFNQISKSKYSVDQDELRIYFPMEQTLVGMFRIYEKIFGLKFHRVDPPYEWVKDVELYVVTDSKTTEPLGMFYLDLYPREGKYGHFAQFSIEGAALLPNGQYQHPTVALVCNFPKPSADKPSLLKHDDVETLFHEFGHAMHSILTRSKYRSFSGTSVPRDFVEAPSQMLENWVWDKQVLDTFAADYRDASKRFPADTLKRMDQVRKAEIGRDTRFQIALGLIDLTFHGYNDPKQVKNLVETSNRILSEATGIPVQEGSSFASRFGHLMGYDAGYYGYLWAKAISADMASVFEKSKKRYLDETVGMRLRNEIYAAGNSRDVDISIRKFLGRERSLKPFLKYLGIRSK